MLAIQMVTDVLEELEIQEETIMYGIGVIGGYKGQNGTGGLLIIYGNEIQNSGNIISNGTGTTIHPKYATGGSSGGGSVNIFYNNSCNNSGTIEAKGGKSGNGGAGGDGTVTIGKILNGTFVKDEN